MTQNKFKLIRIITAFFLAAIMAQAIIFSNYILALIAIVGAVTIIFASRKKVEGVLADERDLEIGGKSARMALSIFSIFGAATTFVLMFSRNINPVYEVVGSVLAYAVCGLLLLYSALFKYYEKQN
jgi:uncharacterized membrane protein